MPSRHRLPPRTTTLRRSCAVAVALFTLPASAQPLAIGERAGVRRVCASPPAELIVTAARQRVSASEAAATVISNPHVRAEHQRALSGSDETETIIGLGLALPLSGRRGLLREAATERRRQANAEARNALLDAALAFRAVYARAVLDTERVVISRAQQRVLEVLTERTRSLARAGESAQYDVLRQEMQARLHAQRVASLEARAAASFAELETWLGEAALPARASLWELAGGTALRADAARLGSKAGRAPGVVALEAAARASALEARGARRRGIPEPELFAGYRTTSGAATETGHGIALALQLPLPFFDHGQAEAMRAEADAATTRALAAVLRREQRGSARGATRRLERLEKNVRGTELAAAGAKEVETRALALYAAGEASIAELFDALDAAEAARLARIDLAEEIVRTRLELMRALGRQLDSELDGACAGTQGAR